MKKIEKFEEISFSAKPEKLELLKEYAKKNGIAFYCAVNIPESAVSDFENFLKENDVFDEEFEKFLEDLLMVDFTESEMKEHGKK